MWAKPTVQRTAKFRAYFQTKLEIKARKAVSNLEDWLDSPESFPTHHENPEFVFRNIGKVIDFAESNTSSVY